MAFYRSEAFRITQGEKEKKKNSWSFFKNPTDEHERMNDSFSYMSECVVQGCVLPGHVLTAALHNCCMFTHINANIFCQKRKCMRICAISLSQRKTDATRENVAKWQHAKFEKHPSKSEHNKKTKNSIKDETTEKSLQSFIQVKLWQNRKVWTVPALGFRRNLHGSQLIAMTTNYCWVQPMDAGPALILPMMRNQPMTSQLTTVTVGSVWYIFFIYSFVINTYYMKYVPKQKKKKKIKNNKK